MAKATFVFANISEENGQKKVGIYFTDEAGDILEIKWGNEDYINEHLKKFGLKSLDELEDYLTKNPDQEVYKYSYTDKDKKKHEGYSMDKPFPEASEAKQAIVQGKVLVATIIHTWNQNISQFCRCCAIPEREKLSIYF